MIITIVADVLGASNNGTSITAKRLIEHLEGRGHHVRIVAAELENIENKSYGVGVRNFTILNDYVAKNGVKLAKPDPVVLKKAIEGSDVVHVMMPFKLGQQAAKIAKKMNIPCTAGFHVQPENFSTHIKCKDVKFVNDYLYSRFDRKLYKNVGHIHCPSEYIASELLSHKYKSKIHVISNGVSTEYKPISSEKPLEYKDKFCILFTGRMSYEKRHDVLIDAVYKSKYINDIQIIFAGDGPRKEKILKQAENLPNKLDIGFHTSEELNKIINYCDLYVHPADIEIEAISCLEAITCGLVPVISNSPRSATRYFALNENNLFEPGNPESLRDKIDFFIENPEYKNSLAKEYVEYGKRFEIASCMDRMEEMFLEAVGGK